MKIIKPGVKPEDEIMRGGCRKCGCEVECAKSETTDMNERGLPKAWGVKCPTCGGWIYAHPFRPENIVPPQGGTGAVRPKVLYHEFDSAWVCDFCNALAENTHGEPCPARRQP